MQSFFEENNPDSTICWTIIQFVESISEASSLAIPEKSFMRSGYNFKLLHKALQKR